MSTNTRALVLAALVVVIGAMWALSFGSKRLERVASGIAALAPRHFETLTLVAAGSGGTYENHLRLGPCLVVGLGDTLVAIDAGRATAQALRRAQIPVEQPVLLLTSLLPENTLGLDDWIWGATLAGAARLRIFGPAGTRALADGIVSARAATARAGAAAFGLTGDPEIDVVEAEHGFTAEIGPLALRATALNGGPLPALAWRVEGGGRSVVVSGAGFDPDALVDAAQGADLWAHEVLQGASLDRAIAADPARGESLAREGALHTRLEEVGALAARAGAKKLALVRLRPPPVYGFTYRRLVAETFRGQVFLPEDGEEIRP